LSYYEKQVAQEAARGVAGVAQVVNNIDVVARPAQKLNPSQNP
jgi:osmotically-inducible protein OsmY